MAHVYHMRMYTCSHVCIYCTDVHTCTACARMRNIDLLTHVHRAKDMHSFIHVRCLSACMCVSVCVCVSVCEHEAMPNHTHKMIFIVSTHACICARCAYGSVCIQVCIYVRMMLPTYSATPNAHVHCSTSATIHDRINTYTRTCIQS